MAEAMVLHLKGKRNPRPGLFGRSHIATTLPSCKRERKTNDRHNRKEEWVGHFPSENARLLNDNPDKDFFGMSALEDSG
jgi:hypothetical protein